VRAADQFHVGIVVDDLDRALAELTGLFGYDWGGEVDVTQPVHVPTGEITVRFRFRYSRTTPRVEVIQSQPGTLWTAEAGSRIHHLGYWSDDVGRGRRRAGGGRLRPGGGRHRRRGQADLGVPPQPGRSADRAGQPRAGAVAVDDVAAAAVIELPVQVRG
jgi:Glyoxalase/Bleomycin resistance protein/Dioxygenase superfamily